MNVVDTLNVLRPYAFLIHEVSIVGDIVIHMSDLLNDLFVLDLQDLFAGCCLNFSLIIVFHGLLLLFAHLKRRGTC